MMNKKRRGESRRKKRFADDSTPTVSEPQDSTSESEGANPNSWTSPPPIRQDERGREETSRFWGSFYPSRGRGKKDPSRALAAFRLGHRGVSMRECARVFWNVIAFGPEDLLGPMHANVAVPNTSDDLLAARRVLVDLIPENVLLSLASTIEWFKGSNQRWIEKAAAGETLSSAFIGAEPLWMAASMELRFHCDRAIPKSHTLRPLFDLGVAFGEFNLLVSQWSPRRAENQFPVIGEIARRAASIQHSVPSLSPLLSSLARIGHDYDRIDHPHAFLQYFEDNQEYWAASRYRKRSKAERRRWILGPEGLDGKTSSEIPLGDEQVPEPDDREALILMAREQVYAFEEVLAEIPDTNWELGTSTPIVERTPNRTKPRWNKYVRALWVNEIPIHSYEGNARRQTYLLDLFEDAGWPVKPESIRVPPEQCPYLDQTLKDLRIRTRTHFTFHRRGDRVFWEWTQDPQNF